MLERNDAAKRETEIERLKIAIRDNIVTPEVKANGFGGIDNARFARVDRSARDRLKVQGGEAEAGGHF